MNGSGSSDWSGSPDCFATFATPEFVNVAIVRGVLSSVSLLMCSGALLLIAVLKRWRVFSQKLIIYLLTSAALASIGGIISVDFGHRVSPALHGFCMFSAFTQQVTTWMLQNAIFAVTIYLFVLIVLDYNTDKYKWVYVFGIFIIPLLVNWIPFLQSAYGRSGVWCWIRNIDEETCDDFRFGRYLQFFLFYAPIYLLLFIGSILYVIIFIDISRKQRKPDWVTGQEMQIRLKTMKSELLSLAAYPVIFAVLNLPLIINRVYFLRHPEQPILALWYFSALFGPLEGIFTAIAFTVGTKTWQNFSCRKFWAAFKKDRLIERYPLETDVASDSYNAQDHDYWSFNRNITL